MDEISSKVVHIKPSRIWQDYVGKYTHPGYGDFTVIVKDDSHLANIKLMKLFLERYHYDVFKSSEVAKDGIKEIAVSDLLFNFSTNDGGDFQD